MASGISLLMGSLIPTIPRTIKFLAIFSIGDDF